MCFKKKGKLSLRYIGSFEIILQVGDVTYCLTLPPVLSSVHNVFHVSILHKYIIDNSHVLSYDSFEVDLELSYEEKPIQILDRKE